MNKWDITNQKGWIIVKGESVYEFLTYQEAMIYMDIIGGGTMMTTEFYKHHYSKRNIDDKKSN